MLQRSRKPKLKKRIQNIRSRRENSAPGPNAGQMFRSRSKYKSSYFVHYPTQLMHTYGDIVCVPDPNITHFVMNPDVIATVLKDKIENYTKENLIYRQMKYALGDNILTSEGDFWLQSRHALQKAFQPSALKKYYEQIIPNTELLINHWLNHAKKNIQFDSCLEITYITLLNSVLIQLNENFADRLVHFTHDIRYLNKCISNFKNPYLPKLRNIAFHYKKRRVDKYINELIVKKANSEPDDNSILALLLNNPKLDEQYKSPHHILNNIKTMLVSGYETTAALLSWTVYLLARHPEIQHTLRNEVLTAFGTRVPEYQQLMKLPYLQAVLQESLRLYPPIWNTNRMALEGDTLGGYDLPQHSMVIIHFYALHRHPDIWPEANTFDPTRFLKEQAKSRPRFTYLPFGTGHHQCIASQFAMLEAKLMLCRIMQNMSLKFVGRLQPKPLPYITLQPDKPVWLKATPIQN